MGSRRYQSCGKCDGSEPTGKWLRIILFNLKEAEVVKTPEVFFKSNNFSFFVEAVDWVDLTPQFQIFTEQHEELTKEDLKEF